MANKAQLPEGQTQFKTNEVCKLARVQPYMLKYWERYFTGLEPEITGTGQRLYSKEQVETILEISRLLTEEGLTVPGARKRIDAMRGGKTVTESPAKAPTAAGKTGKTAVPEKKEVDNKAPEDVQTLLAALRDVRKELLDVVGDLKKEHEVGT